MSKEPKTEQVEGPKVIAVFRADCRATKGFGTTVAVVQGGSGKCRLYGKDSLANAFPEIAPECRTLVSAESMAAYFHCTLADGKAACDEFVKRQAVKWDGKEAVLADKGKSDRKRKGGFKRLNYAAF